PHPPHQYGTVSPPPPPSPDHSTRNETEVPQPKVEIELRTAPADWRFPVQNQMRHCYTRASKQREKTIHRATSLRDTPYYRSLCPLEWIQRWNKQVEEGTFPGPI
ncbi:hypothetical protein RND81_08G138300, partial [Saponaria officinalis]